MLPPPLFSMFSISPDAAIRARVAAMLSVTISAAANARRPAAASTSTGAPSSTAATNAACSAASESWSCHETLLDAEAGNARHRRAAAARDHGQAAVGEVHRQVAVLGEHPHAPLGAHGDARGGDRRDRAVGEADARVGDVGMLAGHRGADGVHAFDLAGDQRQDQVEIVDHQVEDHRDVGAALLERRDAGGLDVERRAEPAVHARERGGEALQVADLQHQLRSAARAASSSACASVAAIGFSTSTCLPARSACDSKRMVRLGRGGDHQRVAGGQQRREVHRRRAGLPADGLGAFGVGIEYAGQHGALGRRDLQRMVAAEMADARNADAEW